MFPNEQYRQAYAAAIKRTVGITFPDALARVLRIEADPELFAALMKVSAEANGTTFVTDVRRNSEGTIEVSVTPATDSNVTQNKRLGQQYAAQEQRKLARAQVKMRSSVAMLELQGVFGRRFTALALLPSAGISIQSKP